MNQGFNTTVACRLCGTATLMLGTQLCDRCHELETRIQRDPELALKILLEAGALPAYSSTHTGRLSGKVEHRSNTPKSKGF
jgi:hypothetical protein